jgi:3-oxoacyl-[acyl-carrier protein] reductase
MSETWRGVQVLVTGGSKGIGLGIAKAFSSAGADVAITGRDGDALRAAAATLDGAGRILPVQGDVASRDGCLAIAEQISSAWGGLDVLCANAGIYPERQIIDLGESDVDTVLDTNLKGTIYMVQAASLLLQASARGRVLVTSSITGTVTGYPGLSVYGASKAAQIGFVKSAALEFARWAVTVNALLPGSVHTEGLDGLGTEAIAQMESCIPLRRLGTTGELGAAALFLASVGAGFVTGQTLVVDGGQTLPELPGQ